MAVPRLTTIPVDRIRVEEGLGRKRSREGHKDLCRSIERFGVLTPIAVRPAPDKSGDYLLIKGQGRTLACRLLGITIIPAVVLNGHAATSEKVQQFLVENVARLRMRPIDRALLISGARKQGEETVEIAKRFAVSPATVRRLEAQLDGASSSEIAALQSGDVSLAVHRTIARHVPARERTAVIRTLTRYRMTSRELEALFVALDWRSLSDLGVSERDKRLRLLEWACSTLSESPRSDLRDRFRDLARRLPMQLDRLPLTSTAV
jgi:ParB/RepB/Spo0J family partition protein